MWNTNPNIRGTYSYHSIDSDKLNAKNEDLEEPIMKNNKPVSTCKYTSQVSSIISN